MRLWVGGYGAGMGGSATGIGSLHLGDADVPTPWGPLTFRGDAAAAASASWLAQHPTLDVVYASLEGDGTVAAYRRRGDDVLVPLPLSESRDTAVWVGELPCHIAVAPDATHLIVSCWGDGAIVRIRLDSEGQLGVTDPLPPAEDPWLGVPAGVDLRAPRTVGQSGLLAVDPREMDALIGTTTARDEALAAATRALRAAAGDEFAHLLPDVPDEPEQETSDRAEDAAPVADPHARVSRSHQAVFLPRGLVATVDMGLDLVRFWHRRTLVASVPLPQGSGPRHAVWHPSGHLYVLTEISNELFALAPAADGSWSIVSGVQVSAEAVPGRDLSAELVLSRDGTRLYAGLRGSDTIAALSVRGAGERIDALALAETGVTWPRHHVLIDDTLVVAGERSSSVATLVLDERTGIPTRPRARVEVPSPTMLLRAR